MTAATQLDLLDLLDPEKDDSGYRSPGVLPLAPPKRSLRAVPDPIAAGEGEVPYPERGWRDLTDCAPIGNDPRQFDDELWLPEVAANVLPARADEAKRICDNCPVATSCAANAYRTQRESGWNGGVWLGNRPGTAKKPGVMSARANRELYEKAWEGQPNRTIPDGAGLPVAVRSR